MNHFQQMKDYGRRTETAVRYVVSTWLCQICALHEKIRHGQAELLSMSSDTTLSAQNQDRTSCHEDATVEKRREY